MIARERERQRQQWGDLHDDGHTGGQMAWAAVCYAAPGGIVYRLNAGAAQHTFRDPWPWRHHEDSRKPNGQNYPDVQPDSGPYRIRMLVKAGALIAAEIDRLQRLEQRLGRKRPTRST